MTHDRSGGGHDEGQGFTNSIVFFFYFLFFLPSEVPKLPQLLDEQLDSSCHIHASCCPRTGLKAATTCFKSLKMSSTND
jgi:hypothetical protein